MPDPVVTRAEGGTEIVRSAEDAALLHSDVVDQASRDAGARDQRRRLMFHTTGDAVKTFVEGTVDALSMGLIRETGEAADIRRGENPGSALAGNVLGFAAGMGIGGPVRGVARAAEGLGETAARGILRASEKSIATRAVTEAATSAALAGGQAFGHQLMDSLLEDKEFSSEAILHEVKLAGVMGALGGAALGGLGRMAARDIADQGGLVGDLETAMKPHREAIRAYDSVMERHAAEVGAMRQLHAEGHMPEGPLKVRIDALNNAARARDALDNISETRALSGTDDVAYKKWQKAGVRYRAAVTQLDAVMDSPIVTGNGHERLASLIDRIPVRSDIPASLRFADTPAEAGPVGADQFAPENAVRQPNLNPDDPFAPEQGLVAPEAPAVDVGRFERGIKPARPERAPIDVSWKTQVPAPAPGVSTFDDITPPARPARGTPDRVTREMAADPEMVGQRKPITNANDLPDIYEPGGTGAGTPPAPTSGARPQPMVEPELPPSAKPRPLDVAEAQVRSAMADLEQRAGSRLNSAGGLGVLEAAGIRPAGDNVGAYMDQVYALRKTAKLAALPGKAKGALKEAFGAALAGGAVGGKAGAAAAVAADLLYLRRGGRIAAASGRLVKTVAGAAEKLLTSRSIRSVAAATANKPHVYSDRGPLKDPVERIQEIQFLAAHPDAIMERVAGASADLADQPELLGALQQRAVTQVQRLAVRAPAIYFSRLGEPLAPPAGKLRDFLEYENAVHDLGGILDAVARGTVTRTQADALREAWGTTHVKMAAALLGDPDKLRQLSRETLRVVERVTGVPLSNASDPMFLARQGAAWQPPTPPAAPSKPQAFNINPTGAPTPSQANATGRAPGN